MSDTISNMVEKPVPALVSRRLFDKFQRVYVMFAIMIYEGAFTSSLRYLRGGGHLLPGETEITSTIVQAIILSVLCWMWWLRRRYLGLVLRDILPYLLILILCALSALWSDYTFPTLRRSITLSSCVFFGAYCYLTFGLKGTLVLLGRATVVLALLSLGVFVALPGVGHETAQGYESAMRGVFSQKNSLGEAMLLGVSCYVYALIDSRKSLWRNLSSLALLLVSIFLSGSATSLLLALVVMVTGAMLWSAGNWRNRLVVLYLLAVGICLLIAFALVDTTELLRVLNRDPSFTGRMPLWDISFQAAMQRPWLGYGYSGFWNQDSPIVQYIWETIDWQAPSAHNGYLDIVLQIGLVGLAIYAWVWGRTIGLALWAWQDKSLPEARWILLFMLINILLNLDEGPLPYPDQFTVLMPGVLLLLQNWRRERSYRIAARRSRRTPSPASPVFAKWRAGQGR